MDLLIDVSTNPNVKYYVTLQTLVHCYKQAHPQNEDNNGTNLTLDQAYKLVAENQQKHNPNIQSK